MLISSFGGVIALTGCCDASHRKAGHRLYKLLGLILPPRFVVGPSTSGGHLAPHSTPLLVCIPPYDSAFLHCVAGAIWSDDTKGRARNELQRAYYWPTRYACEMDRLSRVVFWNN